MPRPPIDITPYAPSFDDELRWPLSAMAHPSLDPRFPIARELADDVGWQTLCARGVHKRVSATQRELLSYLHGWCDVLERDIDGACEHLVPLLRSTRLGLAPAVRQDLANILVDSGNADIAEHYLSKYDIRDVEVLDLLAASYAELGKPNDALAISRRATATDHRATQANKCRRLVKWIMFAPEHSAAKGIEALAKLAKQPKVPDPVCKRLFHKVACWRNPGDDCLPYFADENIDGTAARLLEVYYRWPVEAEGREWWRIAESARSALSVPGGADLTLAAHAAALNANLHCSLERAASLRYTAEQIRKTPDHARYESRLQKLEAMCVPSEPPQGAAASKLVAPWPSSPATP